MKALLLAIKAALQGGGISGVEDDSVCIVRHENYLPPTATSPAIGIKDGIVRRLELAGGAIELDMTVLVCVWCQIIEDDNFEASVMGSEDDAGVIALAAEVIAKLENNDLGLSGMQRAFAVECRASEAVGMTTTTLQKKTIVMNYVQETTGTCGN